MNDFPKITEGILGEQDIAKTNTELFLSIVGQYFPTAIKDGEIDFTALKEEMGEFAEVGSEHYDFTWAGKQAAKKEAQADLFGKTLRYKPKDSFNPDTTDNLYLEGDNLEVLKLLRRCYRGKIKMIYIDPPYNTDGDFVYRDKFSISDDELAELSGDIIDDERLQKNTKDSAKYHTNWLNLMYPRLRVARELLTEDGVIFISIDDNEVENLKKICIEIFRQENFEGHIHWRRRHNQPNDKTKMIGLVAEHILVFAKNSAYLKSVGVGKLDLTASFSNPDNDPKGPWASKPWKTGSDQSGSRYTITTPNGKVLDGEWMGEEKTYLAYLEEGRIYFPKGGDGMPRKKYYQFEREEEGQCATNWWTHEQFGHNQGANDCMTELFGVKNVFSNPKPIELIRALIKVGNVKDDDIVLDFFSGSASTAHALMKLNSEDNGKRRYILVQLPELTYTFDKNGIEVPKSTAKVAYEQGYRNICEIGKDRIRKAADKIHEEYPNAIFDDGFKVFEVGKTTIRWNLMDDDELTELEKVSNDTEKLDFTDGHNDTDIVYEIMLRQYGIPLSTPIEKLNDVSDRTYIFADAVVVCLEPVITDDIIEKLADIEPIPAKFVLRDSAFGDNIEFKDFSFRKLSALISTHQTDEERKSKYNNYTVEFI